MPGSLYATRTATMHPVAAAAGVRGAKHGPHTSLSLSLSLSLSHI